MRNFHAILYEWTTFSAWSLNGHPGVKRRQFQKPAKCHVRWLIKASAFRFDQLVDVEINFD